MNFSSPEKVASVIQNLKDNERRGLNGGRAANRGLINALFNGNPPWTTSEARENHIQWNVNWGEGADLLLQAREQLENAHLSTEFAFTARLPDAPKSKQAAYSQQITRLANRLIRGSLPYFHTQRMKWGSVALHGPGSQMWHDAWAWRPHFVGIDDLLIPTDTEITLDNLNHFAVRRRITPGQLFRKTFGRDEAHRDPGWNLKAVQKVLDQYKDVNQTLNTYNWSEHPEKMTELWKQNSNYYDSDAVPVIWAWDFYFQEDESAEPCWYRKILLDNDCVPGRNAASTDNPILYLYDSQKPHAKSIDQILHIQFIDGNNVPPFMYHSCRGLGLRLHDAVHASNRTRCMFLQKVHEDMMLLFRAADPVDRSRLNEIYLGMNYGLIPDGLSFVTREQRYTPDPKLVEMLLSNLKQVMGEGSQQYTQDIDTGTKKERTAFEVSTLLNQSTRLTSSMLNLSYHQEKPAYAEICRRLTLKDTLDWDAKRFQNDCRQAGIPEKWIDSSRWEIEPIRVLGGGNMQLEQAQATTLFQNRDAFDPESQAEIRNDFVFAITHDPKRANRIAPIDAAPKVTDTVHDTELVFGALMGGSLVTPKSGLVPAEVCATMLRLMGATVRRVMQTGGVGTPQDVMGLQNAARYTGAFIQQIAQDRTQKELAKQFADRLGQVMNMVKAMAQRQQEQMARNGNGMDPETMAKLQADQAITQQKLQAKQAADAQKLRSKELTQRQKLAHSEQDFALDQRRKHAEAITDIHNKSMQAAVDASRAQQEPEAPESE